MVCDRPAAGWDMPFKDPAKHAAILGIQGRGAQQALVRLCLHLDKGCEGFWAVAQPGRVQVGAPCPQQLLGRHIGAAAQALQPRRLRARLLQQAYCPARGLQRLRAHMKVSAYALANAHLQKLSMRTAGAEQLLGRALGAARPADLLCRYRLSKAACGSRWHHSPLAGLSWHDQPSLSTTGKAAVHPGAKRRTPLS